MSIIIKDIKSFRDFLREYWNQNYCDPKFITLERDNFLELFADARREAQVKMDINTPISFILYGIRIEIRNRVPILEITGVKL